MFKKDDLVVCVNDDLLDGSTIHAGDEYVVSGIGDDDLVELVGIDPVVHGFHPSRFKLVQE